MGSNTVRIVRYVVEQTPSQQYLVAYLTKDDQGKEGRGVMAILGTEARDRIAAELLASAHNRRLYAEEQQAIAETALERINYIRNSIVGLQTVNWSEHIYPLVAALNEAGVRGMEYPEARKKFGTTLEIIDAWRGILEQVVIQDRNAKLQDIKDPDVLRFGLEAVAQKADTALAQWPKREGA